MRPDGLSPDGSVVVEVFAHIGRMKAAQRNKVSADLLKLVAIRERQKDARLILAFVDQHAAASVSGWRSEILKNHGIEIVVVELDNHDRLKVETAQSNQRMVNPS